jgi:hypothetical protein
MDEQRHPRGEGPSLRTTTTGTCWPISAKDATSFRSASGLRVRSFS